MKMLTAEQIEENFKRYLGLCGKVGDRSPVMIEMVEALGERLAVCPASTRTNFHNAFPGGLVDHSLRVLTNAMNLIKAYGWKVPKDSLIIGTLFHDIGKVGDHEKDLYLPQTDSWKKDKYGELYTWNADLPYMSVPHRSIFLCQHYGLRLTHDEMLALLLNDGQYAEENKSYQLKEPLLADVVHMADLIATKQEKGLTPQ
jgi:putative nucleotidyltransferase with HDIG domain